MKHDLLEDRQLPLVSVLIPFHNAAGTISFALQQLDLLDYPRLEFVFIDDGSSDDAAVLVAAWVASHPKARLLIHSTNLGIGVTRCDLLAAANGDYVWFVDADDKWQPSIVSDLVAACIDNAADVAICSFRQTSADGRKKRETVYLPQLIAGRDIAPLLYREQVTGQLWNKLLRRTLFGTVEPFPPLRLREDFVGLVPALSRASRVIFIPSVLYQYIRHPQSLVSKQPYDRLSLAAPVQVLAATFPADWWHGLPTSYLTMRFYLRSYLLQIVKHYFTSLLLFSRQTRQMLFGSRFRVPDLPNGVPRRR